MRFDRFDDVPAVALPEPDHLRNQRRGVLQVGVEDDRRIAD